MMDYILVKPGKKVPSLDSSVHIVDLRVNVLVRVREPEKVHMLTLQEILETLVVGSRPVSIQEKVHLHHCRLKVKIQVLQASYHFPFPFQVTMELLHMQVLHLLPRVSFLVSFLHLKEMQLSQKIYQFQAFLPFHHQHSLEFQFRICTDLHPKADQNKPFPFLVIDP
jgi:hypothetical protein